MKKHNYYKIRVSKSSIKNNLLFITDLLIQQKVLNQNNYSVIYFTEDEFSNAIINNKIFYEQNITIFPKQLTDCKNIDFLFLIFPENSFKLSFLQKKKLRKSFPKNVIFLTLVPENKKIKKVPSITDSFIDGHFYF